MITAAYTSYANLSQARPNQPSISDGQKAQITALLSDYDPAAVNRGQAREIAAGLRDIGVKPGRALAETLADNGFDAKKLASLVRPERDAAGPPPPERPALRLDSAALDTLQEIADKFDLANLSETENAEIQSRLQEIGLNYRGGGRLVDIRV